MPRSPWLASAGWTNRAGVPVDASVEAIFAPTWPDLPMPVTITRPSTFRISLTAATKPPLRPLRSAARKASMPPPSASSVRRADAIAPSGRELSAGSGKAIGTPFGLCTTAGQVSSVNGLGGENLPDSCFDPADGYVRGAVVGDGVIAFRARAGSRFGISLGLQDGRNAIKRLPVPRAGRAENGHGWRAERGGDVHQSGIVTDRNVGGREREDCVAQVGAGQIARIRSGRGGDVSGDLGLVRTAEHPDGRPGAG